MSNYESPCVDPLGFDEAPTEAPTLALFDPSVLPEFELFELDEPLTVELSLDEDPESVLFEVPEVVVVDAED